MFDERYFIKVVPQRAQTVHRFEVRRRQLLAVLTLAALALAAALGTVMFGVLHARAQVAALRSLAAKQRAQIESIDSKTAAIRRQLLRVQRQNQQIAQLIGVHPHAAPSKAPAAAARRRTPSPVSLVARHVEVLAADSSQTLQESDLLRRLTMHVLNVRHIQELTRARLLAAIPSIDPVPGAPVIGCFCYRTAPDVEFHEGVDLGADWGDPVHAAAAGTVVSAGWDGGYGIKIDIDHGNGYHTWYAHLSSVDVRPGQYVYKGQTIAAVGSTGFSTGPHLHYQIMLDGSPVDPSPYLNGVPAKVLASLP